MNVQDIKDKIKYGSFDCGVEIHSNKICETCVFVRDNNLHHCGEYSNLFDFEAIKLSKVRTLKGLLKFKRKTNNYKYPKLK